jgi:hypothetical protein
MPDKGNNNVNFVKDMLIYSIAILMPLYLYVTYMMWLGVYMWRECQKKGITILY